MVRIVLGFGFLVVSVFAEAQSFYALRRERSLILVAGTGTSTYLGELSNPGDYLDAKPTLTVGLQHKLIDRLSLRADVTWFQLRGNDAKADDGSRQRRNLSFQSNNFELGVSGVLSLYKSGRRFYQRPLINFYAFGGVGLCYFNPTTEYQGERITLRPLQTEGVAYSRFTPVIPMGLGVRFKMGPMFNLSIEGGLRKTFTDYLDDVSTVHLGASAFSDPLAAALSDRRAELGLTTVPAGTQRGNPGSEDAYFLLNAKLEYYLPVDFLAKKTQKSFYKRKRNTAYKRYNQRRRR